jgi:nucleoside-diphosphate-sugar epimerase
MINGRTFYLCDYNPLSLRDYADSLANHLHAPKIPSLPLPVAQTLAYCGDILNGLGISRFPFNSFRLNNITTEYIFDTTATEEVCGALPHTMEDGIAQTAAWYLSELGKR